MRKLICDLLFNTSLSFLGIFGVCLAKEREGDKGRRTKGEMMMCHLVKIKIVSALDKEAENVLPVLE